MMNSDFNPFKALAQNAKLREELVDNYAQVIVEKARAIVNNPTDNSKFFQIPENREWLMSRIDVLQEQDEWDEKDAATLSALYFFLLTSGNDP